MSDRDRFVMAITLGFILGWLLMSLGAELV
jgi:hypothetical protein